MKNACRLDLAEATGALKNPERTELEALVQVFMVKKPHFQCKTSLENYEFPKTMAIIVSRATVFCGRNHSCTI